MKRIYFSVFLLMAASTVAGAADCDRACLKGLITFEAFKVFGKELHEIHAVNAFFRTMPKDTKRGWDSTDPVPPAEPWAEH